MKICIFVFWLLRDEHHAHPVCMKDYGLGAGREIEIARVRAPFRS